MIDCNTCKHIVLTETQQNICGTKEHHRCDEYKHILYHWGKHPKINPCEKCKCDDFKYYIKNENASAYLDDLYTQDGIPEEMFEVKSSNMNYIASETNETYINEIILPRIELIK